jgi:hypothetical protein
MHLKGYIMTYIIRRIVFVILVVAVILAAEAIITNACHWHYVWEYYTGDVRPNSADFCG